MTGNLSINTEKMQDAGYFFDNMSDVYLYIVSLVNYLESHNKNYNKEQYSQIDALKEILEAIDCD